MVLYNVRHIWQGDWQIVTLESWPQVYDISIKWDWVYFHLTKEETEASRINSQRAGEIGQQFRAGIALPEDTSSVPGSHIKQPTSLQLQGVWNPLLASKGTWAHTMCTYAHTSMRVHARMHTHTHTHTHTHIHTPCKIFLNLFLKKIIILGILSFGVNIHLSVSATMCVLL